MHTHEYDELQHLSEYFKNSYIVKIDGLFNLNKVYPLRQLCFKLQIDLKDYWVKEFESSLRLYDYHDAAINFKYIAQHAFERDQKDCQRKIKVQIRDIIDVMKKLPMRRNLDHVDDWVEKYLKLDAVVIFLQSLGDQSFNPTVEEVNNFQQTQKSLLQNILDEAYQKIKQHVKNDIFAKALSDWEKFEENTNRLQDLGFEQYDFSNYVNSHLRERQIHFQNLQIEEFSQ